MNNAGRPAGICRRSSVPGTACGQPRSPGGKERPGLRPRSRPPPPPPPRPARVGLRRGCGRRLQPRSCGGGAERASGAGGGPGSFGGSVPLLESLRAAKAEGGGTETKFPLSPRQAQV